MGRYRIYPDKSNTLISGSPYVNTGENPITEIWYGKSGTTRHLVHFDFTTYTAQYNANYVPHITAATSTFNMINCYPIYEKSYYVGAEPATSVDIDVEMVQQDWDAGLGHDFYGLSTVTGHSNWYSATTTTAWASHGGDFLYTVFSGHVDKGYEDLSGTVTDAIQLWDAFTGNNFGFVVKYNDTYEAFTSEPKTIMKYFTNNANSTVYKRPYIEVNWSTDQITDQRDEIGYNLTKKIYLYLRKNNTLTSAYDVSGVSINYASEELTDVVYPSSSITEQYPGVYYIEFVAPTGATGTTTFTDSWDVKYNTDSVSYVTIGQSGDFTNFDDVWNTSQSNVLQPIDYRVTMPNLQTVYHQGDNVFLDVATYQKYTSTVTVLKNMYYRIDLLDGSDTFEMVGWSAVSYTSDLNGFPMDTTWFHKGYTYRVQFKYTVSGAIVKTAEDEFKFKVI